MPSNSTTWMLATAAPFIGLFGTVVGMLVALKSMVVLGAGGFWVVATGISAALVSTAFGLTVVVVAVMLDYF